MTSGPRLSCRRASGCGTPSKLQTNRRNNRGNRGQLASFGDYQSSGVVVILLSEDVGWSGSGFRFVDQSAFPDDKVKQYVDRRVAQITARSMCLARWLQTCSRDRMRGHASSSPFAGLRQSVKTITTADVKDYYRRALQADNTMLAIVGDIDKSEIKAKVWETFGRWKRSSPFEAPHVPEAHRRLPLQKSRQRAKRTGQKQSSIVRMRRRVRRTIKMLTCSFGTLTDFLQGSLAVGFRYVRRFERGRRFHFQMSPKLWPLSHLVDVPTMEAIVLSGL